MAYNRFDQIIDAWEPRLRDAFLTSIYSIRDTAQINLIAQLLERGDIDGAIRAVGLDPVQFRDLDKAISAAFEEGGRYTTDRLPALRQPNGYRLSVQFDVRNVAAESWLRDHSSTLVSQVLDDQRTAIRQHLVAGMEAGNNPRTVALDLSGRINAVTGRREGGVIGLAASQEAWVRSYALELASGDPNALTRALRDKRFDRSIEKALRAGEPIPADIQAKMVRAYRNRALRYRAETIGRTEAMTSLHQSQMEAMRQAIDAGQIDEAAVTKVWRSAADARVRDTHRALNGQGVAFQGVFTSPSGARLAYPGDPDAPAAERINCRCAVELKVDFLAGIT